MIGICIPAHNEETGIERCLASIQKASAHPALKNEKVLTALVLDRCSDKTEERARRWDIDVLHVTCRNVGMARAAGANHLIQAGARWLAFTDADTAVCEWWLVHQLSLNASVVCGTVGVTGWEQHGRHAHKVRGHFQATYRDRDGHRHIHGANLGVCSTAYLRAGGFRPLPCHEDRDLVERLAHAGATIAWSALPRVTTSARPYSRVDEGFAAALRAGRDRGGKAA